MGNVMKTLVTWLAKRTGVAQTWQDHGYDWGWRAARANPDVSYENRRVPFVG